LFCSQAPHADGQSSRRSEPLYRAVCQARFIEATAHARRERIREREQGLRRQFLGANLD
jgi:hypothetical protein